MPSNHENFDFFRRFRRVRVSPMALVKFISVLVLQGGYFGPLHSASCEKQKDLEAIDSLLMRYDRRANPNEAFGNATLVAIEIFLRSFGSISPATMDYEADLYLYQQWHDPRLSNENISHVLDFSDPKVIQMIWKPEVFFPNAKDANFQYVTVPNVGVRIYPGGLIFYMLRLKLTFSCMMDLSKFPLDRQVCSIELTSFAKTTHDLILTWNSSDPVKVYEGLKLPQFSIETIVTSSCIEKFHNGERSCLRADISLKRSFGYHLVQSYLPTTLIVVVSWVSFWLEVDAIAARVTLGVTTLLTISSETTGTRSNLPPVSYVKALDVWMAGSITFIFMALLEFTCVNYLSRRKRRKRASHQHRKKNSGGAGNNLLHVGLTCITDVQKPRENKSSNCTLVSLPGNNNGNTNGANMAANHMALAKKIDRLSRLLFPLTFVIFNLVYWSYYTL